MTEKITALDGARLDRMLAELEDELTAQGVSALLRLRMTTLLRELVDALRERNDGSGQLRCAVTARRTVHGSTSRWSQERRMPPRPRWP